MNPVQTQAFPSPPKLINSLMAGFESIIQNLGLILFSVCLDAWLWFGPQIRIQNLVQSFLDWLGKNMAVPQSGSTELVTLNMESIRVIGEQLNLVSLIRTFPIGIPSLIISHSSSENPLGRPLNWEVTSLQVFIGISLGMILIGILAGSIYFDFIYQATLKKKMNLESSLKNLPWYFSQVLLLSFFWLGVLVAASIPLACIAPLLFSGNSSLGLFFLVGYGLILTWVLLPLVFAPHGIFVEGYSMWTSILASARLTRFTLPSTFLFILTAILLSQGMDIIWNYTSDSSWLTVLSIIGHAFISASLISASFIHYRDAKIWIERIIQKTKLTSVNT